MKQFNTTAVCVPDMHYMVDLSERVTQIKELVDDGKYFTINRARQYGKTTTLAALERALSGEYDVISIDFQDVTSADFIDESEFVKGLARLLCDTRDSMDIPVPDQYYQSFQELAGRREKFKLNDIFRIFDQWCRGNQKHIVLMIDEVDTAANHQVFLDFLGKFRSNYLKRARNPKFKTFQSVILAGVTDVKHLRSKIRPDDRHKFNSPWNIAADFNIDMSLSENGIKGMLDEYEADYHTGMDTVMMAQTRDQTRTDVIVDYLGQQYVIELKIWRGERYHADGEKQISEYLDYWNLDTGYMLSFNFNQKKEQGVKRGEGGEIRFYLRGFYSIAIRLSRVFWDRSYSGAG